MTVKELAELILVRIEAGELDPDARVVRPFCMCDTDVGYIEARFLDDVRRAWDRAPGIEGEGRIYRYGNSEDVEAVMTVKLD